MIKKINEFNIIYNGYLIVDDLTKKEIKKDSSKAKLNLLIIGNNIGNNTKNMWIIKLSNMF